MATKVVLVSHGKLSEGVADAVENALVLRERTFAARTALASRMRVPGRSRRWENAVLGWEVRPRSDAGARA